MKFSESWLREFVNPAIDSDTLAYRLTMAGLEVEENELAAPVFTDVVVAHILSVAAHSNADRLRVCTVDVGAAEPLQIVCGAPNAAVGMKVPCARVGAVLPGNFVIKAAAIRGIESFGMLCSARELGMSEDGSGLLVLPDDAPVGQDFRTYYVLDDHLLTLKLTPNRADCLSVYGLARDVAAITQSPLKAPQIESVAASTTQQLPITIQAKEACLRYCGRLIQGVNARAKTPDWMVKKLERSGLRSISALVDITNYVLLELGQPLHAFNAGKIQGGIIVRWAQAGEKLTLLNEKEIALESDMLVIADAQKPLALAGIMGGLASAVTEDTVDVFLEGAFFTPATIAGKSRRLGFSSDAAYRYERGVDPALSMLGLERATALVLSICGGSAGPVNDVTVAAPVEKAVAVRLSRINKVLGVEVSASAVMAYLTALGMTPVCTGDVVTVRVPGYRFDIAIEEDIIEEVGRLYSYDNIPVRAAHTVLTMLPLAGAQRTPFDVQLAVAARDYHEVVNYAFVDSAWEQDFAGNIDPVRLQNPIASQMSVMRSSLLGGLIDSLRKNINRKHERIRVFEMGRVFIKTAGEISQPKKLAGLAYGTQLTEQWASAPQWVDFYDVKGDVEAFFHPRRLKFEVVTHPALHPGRAAQVVVDDEMVGVVGELHPKLVQKYDLPRAPVIFELELTALLAHGKVSVGTISKLPSVRRDLALIVADDLPVQRVLDALKSVPHAVIQDIALFDVYKGQGVAAGKKSLAFKVILQDIHKTLTDMEVETVMDQLIVAAHEKCDATLRT